jgi:hypothetical protein
MTEGENDNRALPRWAPLYCITSGYAVAFFEHHLKNHILSTKAKGGAGWLTIALQPNVEAQCGPLSFLKAKNASPRLPGLAFTSRSSTSARPANSRA